MSNPHHFRHYPRQPNVQIIVTDSGGQLLPFLNLVTEMDMFVLHGVVILEVREYAESTSEQPGNVILLTNPAKIMQIAKPDPTQFRMKQ